MSKPLILQPKEFQGKQWQVPVDLTHLQTRALIPLHAGEISKATTTMPIAVVKMGMQWSLVGVCGLTPQHNLLIQEGRWQGKYAPMFLAAYPFELVSAGKVAYVTFEPDSGLLVDNGGQPFYDEKGQFSPAVGQRIELLKKHLNRQVATKKAIEALVEADVLMPWPSAICEQLGMKISGLHLVDERALAALDDAAFLKLRKAQALGIAYALNLSIFQAYRLSEFAKEAGEESSSGNAVKTTGDIDLEFLNDTDTIKFGPMR